MSHVLEGVYAVSPVLPYVCMSRAGRDMVCTTCSIPCLYDTCAGRGILCIMCNVPCLCITCAGRVCICWEGVVCVMSHVCTLDACTADIREHSDRQ